VRIPKAFFPKMQSALEACCQSVQLLPLSPEHARIGILALFECASDDGDVVRVTVQRVKQIEPDQMAAILEPVKSRGFRLFSREVLIDQIQSSLIAHGALPMRQAGDKPC